MTIIEQIEQIRILKGITQRKLSILADITPAYYCRLIAKEANASEIILQKLAQAVNCKIYISLNDE